MTALALGCAALALVATDADARPKHRAKTHAQPVSGMVMNNDGRSVPAAAVAASQRAPVAATTSTSGRRSRQVELGFAKEAASYNSLVAEARKYLGGNPTGRNSLWCGAFMDLVLKRTGHAGGGNLARAYARYGTRVSGPQVGAIAVMTRKGGGHVGIVTGIDASGNPVVISGNHNNRVEESVYPRGRIIAYVVP